MVDSVRGRLTLFWMVVLAAALVVIGGLIYILLGRALYQRIDENLRAVAQITATSLANDLAEGQDFADAARSTAAELSSRQQMLALYDVQGQLLAEGGWDDDLTIPTRLVLAARAELAWFTLSEDNDPDDRHRLALQRVTVAPLDARYVIVAGAPLEPTDEELESLREILAYVVPIALLLAGGGGWFLARQSLAPVGAMADRARVIGAEDSSARLPVGNPRDELGRLAQAFNELLERLDASLTQQRQFMADASHELRTPVATARTAASVALQQPHRTEREYRQTLEIIEQQSARLSRIVEDMFTLARADAGSYPVRSGLMYLDEVVEEVVRAAQVLAGRKRVTIHLTTVESAAYAGDEELVRRLTANLLDNAVRHAPEESVVSVDLQRRSDGYALSVTDNGAGIPPDAQGHIFERFYRGDAARTTAGGGAGLGLALARWIARAHGGDVALVGSSPGRTTFTAVLPHR